MRRRVKKVGSAVFVGFLGLAAAFVAAPRGDYRMRDGHPPAPLSLPASLSASPSVSAVPVPSGAPSADLTEEASFGRNSDDTEVADVATDVASSAAPTLTGAPKSLTFGVVLVTFAGAQGASRSARPKAAAEKLANELLPLAEKDFAAAVKKGDPGSTDDAGKMYQGILEPGPEYALFSLEPGHVAGPLPTPRGFWIVRRIK